jgi:hypothetical protein
MPGITLPDPLRWVPSPNFSRRGAPCTLVTVHRWGGGTFPGVQAEFANRSSQVSAHLVYAGETGPHAGECVQMVGYKEKAWHCAAFNSVSIGLECADSIWSGNDNLGFERAARIVAYLLHHIGSPASYVHGEQLVHQPHGFTRHYDLGALGGGHTDPTTDLSVWTKFCALVKMEAQRGGFRPVWGRE